MLFAHPGSTCDICLDEYSWEDSASRKPHALGCGHIYCLQCLENTSPRVCPLCRSLYTLERIKKLHIEPPAPEPQDRIVAQDLLTRIALLSRARTPHDEAYTALDEADAFVAQNPNCSLREAVENLAHSIRNYRSLTKRYTQQDATILALQEQLHVKEAEHHEALTLQDSLRIRIRELERQLGIANRAARAPRERADLSAQAPAGGHYIQSHRGRSGSTSRSAIEQQSDGLPAIVGQYEGGPVYSRIPSPKYFPQPRRRIPSDAPPLPRLRPIIFHLPPEELVARDLPPDHGPVYVLNEQIDPRLTLPPDITSLELISRPPNTRSSSRNSSHISAQSSRESLAEILGERRTEDNDVIMPGNALGIGSLSGRASPVRSVRSRSGSIGASSNVDPGSARSRSGSFGASSNFGGTPFVPMDSEPEHGAPSWSRTNSSGNRHSDGWSNPSSFLPDASTGMRHRGFTYPSSTSYRAPTPAAPTPFYSTTGTYSSTSNAILPSNGTVSPFLSMSPPRPFSRARSGSGSAGASSRVGMTPLEPVDVASRTRSDSRASRGSDGRNAAPFPSPTQRREFTRPHVDGSRRPAATPYPSSALGLSLGSPSPPINPPAAPRLAANHILPDGIVSPLNSEQSWSALSSPLLDNIPPVRLAPVQSPPNGPPRATEPVFGLHAMNSRSSLFASPPTSEQSEHPAAVFIPPPSTNSYFSPPTSVQGSQHLASASSSRTGLPTSEAAGPSVEGAQRYHNNAAPGVAGHTAGRASSPATAGPLYPYDGSTQAFASFTQAGYASMNRNQKR